jgi:hypothetical protein
VVWRASSSGESFGRYFNGSGTPGVEFQISADTGGSQPLVAVDAANGFVAVWWTVQQAIFARRYSVTGDPDGDAFLVDPLGEWPSITADAAGRVIVVWDEAGTHSVEVRRYQVDDASLCSDVTCPPFYTPVAVYYPEGGGTCICLPSAVDPSVIEIEINIIDIVSKYVQDVELCYRKGVDKLVRSAPFALSECLARAAVKYDRATADLVAPVGVDLAALQRAFAAAIQNLDGPLFCNQAGSARALPPEYGAGWLPASATVERTELGAAKLVRKQTRAIGKCLAKGVGDFVRARPWLVSNCVATARAKAVAAGRKLDFTSPGFGPGTDCYTDGGLGDLAEHVEAVTVGLLGEAFPGR